MHQQRLFLAICAGLGSISVFLSWVSAVLDQNYPVYVSGWDLGWTGRLCLVLFVIALLISILEDRDQVLPPARQLTAVVCFGLSLLPSGYILIGIWGQSNEAVKISSHLGLWLAISAALAGIALAYLWEQIKWKSPES